MTPEAAIEARCQAAIDQADAAHQTALATAQRDQLIHETEESSLRAAGDQDGAYAALERLRNAIDAQYTARDAWRTAHSLAEARRRIELAQLGYRPRAPRQTPRPGQRAILNCMGRSAGTVIDHTAQACPASVSPMTPFQAPAGRIAVQLDNGRPWKGTPDQIELIATPPDHHDKDTPAMPAAALAPEDLGQFTGTETWHRHGLNRDLLYTDGVKFLADRAGAYWLVDEIAIAQRIPKVARQTFQVWTLKVDPQHHATLTCDDGNDNTIITIEIERTDFPLPEIKLYCTDNTILLTSEY